MGMYVYLHRETGVEAGDDDDVFADGTQFQCVKFSGAIAAVALDMDPSLFYEPGVVALDFEFISKLVVRINDLPLVSELDTLKLGLLEKWLQYADHDSRLVFA